MSEATQVLGLIDESFRTDARFSNGNGTRSQSMTWYDVLKALETQVQASVEVPVGQITSPSSSAKYSAHPVLETLQIAPVESPICLNLMVLQSLRARLVDRYADLPP